MDWLPEPEPGTPICLGFDGSDVNDWSALRAETLDGFQFTPRFGPRLEPTIWIPRQLPGGRVDRLQVAGAIDEIFDRFRVERFYYDPPRWETDGEQWAAKHGEKAVIAWETYRPRQMTAAFERYLADLQANRIRHDGCQLTAQSMANAVMIAKGQQYKLGKPNDHQKIDPTMASVLAHEAAADARATGWTAEPADTRVYCF